MKPAVNSASPSPAAARMVWILTFVLVAIAAAVVARRTMALLYPVSATSGPPGAAGLDEGFAGHRLLTLAHIFPGLVFVLLGPLQFASSLRARHPRLHRWSGRVFLVAALAVGATALLMSPQMSIGGLAETAATSFFGLLFLFSLAKAFLSIRRRQVALHREWMIRAFAIGLAVAFIRPVVAIFFIASRFTHWTPRDFFGAAFWIGFCIQLIAAELWINYTRSSLTRS